MTSINYEDIFSEFLGSVTDYDFIHLDDTTNYTLMSEWLHKALSRPYIRRLFASLKFDDVFETVEFELEDNTDEYSDIDFVTYIAAKGMVCEWLEPHVKKTSIINQMFGGKEQKMFSQAQHLSEIRALLSDLKTEVRHLIRDRGYIYNSYLMNVTAPTAAEEEIPEDNTNTEDTDTDVEL